MINKKIAIIGLGNMGCAIRDGMLKKKLIDKSQLFVSNKQSTNKIVVNQSKILIIAVKPQVIKTVLEEIKNVISKHKLIISIAASVEIKKIKQILGKKQKIIRVMPNLCAKVNQSISCWVKSEEVNNNDVVIFKKIFRSIGQEIEIKNENLLDQITVISGSGPAYLFYLAELLEKSAIKIGLGKRLAKNLVTQTFYGSINLLRKSQESPEILRENVTSKGGVTEAAFKVINQSKFEDVFTKAVNSAYKKAKQLGYLISFLLFIIFIL